jgi:transglutaminase-like putative cysteine protease
MKLSRIAPIVAGVIAAVVLNVNAAGKLGDLTRDEWMSIYSGTNRVGYRHITVSPDKLKGKDVYHMEDTAMMRTKFSVYGSMQFDSTFRVYFGRDFKPVSAYFAGRSSGRCMTADNKPTDSISVTGTVDFDYKKRRESLTLHSGGRTEHRQFDIDDENGLVRIGMYQLGVKHPSIGDKFSIFSSYPRSVVLWWFEMPPFQTPTAVVTKREEITAGGKTYSALVVRENDFTRWQADNGEIIKDANKDGSVTCVLETKENALKDMDKVCPDLSCIHTDKAIVNSACVSDLRVRFIGDWNKEMIVNDARQTAEFHPEQNMVEYHIVSQTFDALKSAHLPITGRELETWTGPTSGIDSSNSEIRTLALKTIGGETNAYLAACKIRDWVYRNIRYDTKYVPMDAIAILKAKSGVCTHHAVLFTALCRAVGIPARLVDGFCYDPDPQSSSFCQHEWAECYVGEWVAFDPTTGIDFVDAAHLKVHQGNIDDMADLFQYAAKLTAVVVDYKIADYTLVNNYGGSQSSDSSGRVAIANPNGGDPVLLDKDLMAKLSEIAVKYGTDVESLMFGWRIPADKDIPLSNWTNELDVRFTGDWPSEVFNELVTKDSRQTATCKAEAKSVEYHVEAKRFDPAKSLSIPVQNEDCAKWAEESPGIESSNIEIGQAMPKIIGEERNAYKVACKIRAWVYANVKDEVPVKVVDGKPNLPGPPDALDALNSKSDRATGMNHRLLFTALARAAGIPTRLVYGFRYAPWQTKQAFQTDEWVECYVGEWVPFDPTSDGDYVEAARIKLVVGNVADMLDGFKGKWRAEVLGFNYLPNTPLPAGSISADRSGK